MSKSNNNFYKLGKNDLLFGLHRLIKSVETDIDNDVYVDEVDIKIYRDSFGFHIKFFNLNR